MGKSSPSIPQPTNPAALTRMQGRENRQALAESMRLNAVDMYGPAGSTTYGRRGDGTPHSQYTNLTPAAQQIFAGQQATAQNMTDVAQVKSGQIPTDIFTLAGLPYDPSSYNLSSFGGGFDPMSYSRNAGQNVYGNQMGGPSPTSGWGQPQPGAPQSGPSTSGGLNPEYARIEGQNQLGRTKWESQQTGVHAGMDQRQREYQSAVDRERHRWSQPMQMKLNYDPLAEKRTGGGQQAGGGKGGAVGQPGQKGPSGANRWKSQFGDQYAIDKVKRGKDGKYIVKYKNAGEFKPQTQMDYGQAPEGFDKDYYLKQNADVAQAGVDAWEHYSKWGRNEGRKAFKPFEAQELPEQYIQPQAPGGQPPQPPQGPAPGMMGQNGGPPQGFPPQAPQVASNQGAGTASGGDPYGNGQTPLSYGGSTGRGLPYDPNSYGNIDTHTESVQDAVMDQQMRNLRPEMDMQYRRQVQQLQDRGLSPGTEAWRTATAELNRNQGNQMQQAANQAMAAGGAEAQRRMGMEQSLRSTAWNEAVQKYNLNQSSQMQGLQAQQNLRNQALRERLLQRNQTINEASAAIQGSPAMPMPQAPKMPNYQLNPVDTAGIYQNADNARMAAYNAQAGAASAQSAGMGQAVSGLASLAMKSSREWKDTIDTAPDVLDALVSLDVDRWRYKGENEEHIGPYAEDFAATLGFGDGKHINIVDAIGVLIKAVQELNAKVDKEAAWRS